MDAEVKHAKIGGIYGKNTSEPICFSGRMGGGSGRPIFVGNWFVLASRLDGSTIYDVGRLPGLWLHASYDTGRPIHRLCGRGFCNGLGSGMGVQPLSGVRSHITLL